MLSNSTNYGIRAVIYLAIHTTKDNKLGSLEIAKKLKIPAPFLAKILQDLKRKNIISSAKGPNGGFYLTKKNLQKSLLDVIESTDSSEKYRQCIMGLEECNNITPCSLHSTYEPFKIQFLKKLSDNTIKDFAEDVKNGNSFISID